MAVLTNSNVVRFRYQFSCRAGIPPSRATWRGRHLPFRLVDRTDVAPATTHHRGGGGGQVLELAVIVGGIVVCGAGLVIGFNARAEWAERDQLRRFQEALRASDPHTPSPHDRQE